MGREHAIIILGVVFAVAVFAFLLTVYNQENADPSAYSRAVKVFDANLKDHAESAK
jgi:hypothetical protein